MESNRTEDFRRTTTTRIATCLMGDFERGKHVASYRIPRTLAGIDLVVDCDLGQLSKAVEFDLNALASGHIDRTLRGDYQVRLNTLNGTCHFTAHARCA